jgi:hypothetical protein
MCVLDIGGYHFHAGDDTRVGGLGDVPWLEGVHVCEGVCVDEKIDCMLGQWAEFVFTHHRIAMGCPRLVDDGLGAVSVVP